MKEGRIWDDYDITCIVPRSLRADEPAEDTEALHRAFVAYASDGIYPKPKKPFIGLEDAHFWGASIQGEVGRARAHRELTMRAMTLVLALLEMGRVTPGGFSRRFWGLPCTYLCTRGQLWHSSTQFFMKRIDSVQARSFV